MLIVYCVILLIAGASTAIAQTASHSDTIRLEVGSALINGRIYEPHAARVIVRAGDGDKRVTAEWTNELTHGDSAGRPVHRWVTKGTRFLPAGATQTWEIRQTYDARTLAPYAYHATSSTGGFTRLTIDGKRVRGSKRLAADSAEQSVDLTLDRPGFIASASDLIPLAAGLEEGAVMTAPVWGPAMTASEMRVFTVHRKERVQVEGVEMVAWKVEERRQADGRIVATWYLTAGAPYMVYAVAVFPNGQTQTMSEVVIPSGAK